MSTGLDAYIEQRGDKWYFAIEDPSSHRFDPEFIEEGPFDTIAEMHRAWNRHANPGGFAVDCEDIDAFEKEWDER